MPVSTRNQTRQAKAIVNAQAPTNLNHMPVEIVNLIVDHLRAMPVEKPKASKDWPSCPCVTPEDSEPAKEKAMTFVSDDPSIALSCVSKRMRNVVFDNRTNRSISTSYCAWGMEQAQAASEVMRSNVRKLYLCATNSITHTVDPKQVSLQDLLKLFPNVQYLFLAWDLELAETPMQLLPQVTLSKAVYKAGSPPPVSMFANLTELALDLSDMEWAAAYGGAEMTMLFRYLRLYNLQTLRLRLRVSDVESLEAEEWKRLASAFRNMRFTHLKNVSIDIFIPAYDLAEFDASMVVPLILEAVAQTSSVDNIKLDLQYEFEAKPVVSDLMLDGELCAAYSITQQQIVACVERIKIANPDFKHLLCRLRGMMEQDLDTLCTLVDFHYCAKPSAVEEKQDGASESDPPTAKATIRNDEFQYHLCGGAVDMLIGRLEHHVESRPSLERFFDESLAAML